MGRFSLPHNDDIMDWRGFTALRRNGVIEVWDNDTDTVRIVVKTWKEAQDWIDLNYKIRGHMNPPLSFR